MELPRSTRMLLISLAALGLMGSACDDEEPSGKLRTSEISASISIVAEGDGYADVSATLTTANPRYEEDSDSLFPHSRLSDVRLTDGDRLFAKRLSSETVKGLSRKMKKDRSVDRPRYVRSFEGDEEGSRYRISFSRKKDGRQKARESVVTLPPSLELDWVDDPVALTPAPLPF